MSFVRPDQPDAPKNRSQRPRDRAQGSRPTEPRRSAPSRGDASGAAGRGGVGGQRRGEAGASRGTTGHRGSESPRSDRDSRSGARGAHSGERRGGPVRRSERPEERTGTARKSGTASPRTGSRDAGGRSGGTRRGEAGGRNAGSPRSAAGRTGGVAGTSGGARRTGTPKRRPVSEERKPQPARRPRTSAGPASDNKSQSARMRAQERQKRIAAEQSAQRRRKILILALILVAVVLIGMFAVYLLGNRGGQVAAQQEHPTERWSPVACSPETLKTTLEAPLTSPAGSAIIFKVSVENLSDMHPCSIDVGWDNVDISVNTGTDTIVSSQACGFGAESKRLLLDRSMTTSFEVTWPGGIGDEACATPTASWSQPGSYQAKLSFTDNSAESTQTAFVLE